jgi:hypothetical protein
MGFPAAKCVRLRACLHGCVRFCCGLKFMLVRGTKLRQGESGAARPNISCRGDKLVLQLL